MELIYRSGFEISEAPKFWYNMMTANSVDAEKCLKDISEGKLEPRGKGTHPHPCYCLLYTSPSPRDATLSRMPSSA